MARVTVNNYEVTVNTDDISNLSELANTRRQLHEAAVEANDSQRWASNIIATPYNDRVYHNNTRVLRYALESLASFDAEHPGIQTICVLQDMAAGTTLRYVTPTPSNRTPQPVSYTVSQPA
jgi:anti-sigma factor ChrR (cupin superfamily)